MAEGELRDLLDYFEGSDNEDSQNSAGSAKLPELKFGCEHYRRKCAFITPCCNKEYICRVCHNDKENHEIIRQNIDKVKCLNCAEVQQIGKNCVKCQIEFGKYFCPLCRLFDDEEKKQFHCDGCGICRVGGRENYYHCEKCDVCLAEELRNAHTCVEKSSRSNCAVCLEDLHTSRIPAHIPPCGHLIHIECFKGMLKSSNYACPICSTSMIDMKESWVLVDEEIAQTPMPDEYKDFYVQILCRDCHKESRVVFHVIGLKCQACGSYNTCRTADPEETSVKKVQQQEPQQGEH